VSSRHQFLGADDVLTPEQLWDGLSRAVCGVLERPGVEPKRIAAMAVSSRYGGSGIPVDDDLEPVGPP